MPENSFPLVGMRHEFLAKRFNDHDKSFEIGEFSKGRAYRMIMLGFPPDWFLPLYVANKWQGPFYPREPTADSLEEYRVLMEEIACGYLNFDSQTFVNERANGDQALAERLREAL